MLAKLSIVVAAVAAMTTGYVFNSSSCASKCAAKPVAVACCDCCDVGCECCADGCVCVPAPVAVVKTDCCPSSAAKVVSTKAACCDCCEAGCACCVGGACACAICGCDGNCCVAATPVVAKTKKCCEGGACSDKK